MPADALSDHHILAVEDVLGPVPSVEQALALIAAEPVIHAGVLDINLGGEMAFPIADALLERGVPFVFVTGYDTLDLDSRYQKITRCEKPLVFRKLERALTSLLQDAAA